MDTLLDRFLRYVRIDTQAVELTTAYPSSPGQLVLGKMLVGELRELGLKDAEQDEHGIVMATIPATTKRSAPVIAWLAHMDTSPETTGKDVKPVVHKSYAGDTIVLRSDEETRPGRIPGVESGRRQDGDYDRRHHASGVGQQIRRRGRDGGGEAPARAPGDRARPHPRLLHL
jgi:hypothetical protein